MIPNRFGATLVITAIGVNIRLCVPFSRVVAAGLAVGVAAEATSWTIGILATQRTIGEDLDEDCIDSGGAGYKNDDNKPIRI